MEKLHNQAHFEFDGTINGGTDKVSIGQEDVGLIHAISDNPEAEFDVIIEDMAGNEQLVKRGCKNPTGRWGERIDLPLRDSFYNVRLENVKNVKSIDVFLE